MSLAGSFRMAPHGGLEHWGLHLRAGLLLLAWQLIGTAFMVRPFNPQSFSWNRCAGEQFWGALGNNVGGGGGSSSSPKPVKYGFFYRKLSLAYKAVCGLRVDSTVW